MKPLSQILVLLITSLLLLSCSQKKVFSSGYHGSWDKNQNASSVVPLSNEIVTSKSNDSASLNLVQETQLPTVDSTSKKIEQSGASIDANSLSGELNQSNDIAESTELATSLQSIGETEPPKTFWWSLAGLLATLLSVGLILFSSGSPIAIVAGTILGILVLGLICTGLVISRRRNKKFKQSGETPSSIAKGDRLITLSLTIIAVLILLGGSFLILGQLWI